MSSTGPPVLLLHGFASSAARTWGEAGWLDLLADAGREVIAVDLLGHGVAPKPHEPDAYDTLEERVLDELPDEPVDAVGFSLGARTLLVLASGHPERFHRIVVAGVGENLFRGESTSALLADAVEQAHDPSADDGESPVAGYFRSQAAEAGNDPVALAACLRRPSPPPVTDEGLARIGVPTLVVIGDRDFAGPAEPLAERLPDARVKVLRNVDHFATPKDFGFLDAALDFLGAGLG